ncbi:peptidylprolyl isomerase [Geitlerinema sp. PCC 9228]|jgi:parvulin-like peptidyl-prolyl isomerase|uniref:peptidylprolyl isomerase n=1 Tax=Geitlerinema sp. PCC 9228 TaxID=111611 RepID=UPI0008F9BD62|nr:peptidylprolyl isomerase [Geitlerinema sp. PCC 9228]
MDSQTLISIDNQHISVRQALQYLNATGELPQVIRKILRQHVVSQALADRDDLQLDAQQVEQAIINFRLKNQLVDPQRFEQWLQKQRTTYERFRQQVAESLKIARFKQEVTASDVEEIFEQNKSLFEQVVISRIVVSEKDFAEQLKQQLQENPDNFVSLVKEHSIARDRNRYGMLGPVPVGQLPKAIQEVVQDREIGEILGPVEYENNYQIFRIEDTIAASLSGELKQQLQEQAFERWWQQQLQETKITLHLDGSTQEGVPTDDPPVSEVEDPSNSPS